MDGTGRPQSSPRRVVLVMLIMISLAVALTAAVVLMQRSIRRMRIAANHPPSNAFNGSAPPTTQPATTLPSINQLVAGSASDFAAMQPGSEPLQREPADLPTPPASMSATRLAGFRRQQDRIGEEVSIWSFNGAVADQVDWFYLHAARERGFQEQGTARAAPIPSTMPGRTLKHILIRTAPPPTPGSSNSTATRANAPVQQSLVITIRSVPPDELRVTLWLRYPIMQR